MGKLRHHPLLPHRLWYLPTSVIILGGWGRLIIWSGSTSNGTWIHQVEATLNREYCEVLQRALWFNPPRVTWGSQRIPSWFTQNESPIMSFWRYHLSPLKAPTPLTTSLHGVLFGLVSNHEVWLNDPCPIHPPHPQTMAKPSRGYGCCQQLSAILVYQANLIQSLPTAPQLKQL